MYPGNETHTNPGLGTRLSTLLLISWPSGLTARKDEFEVKRLPLQGENTDTGACKLPWRVTLQHSNVHA